MYLKSITLKGFKSFPDRTRLEFGPGVSVIVGPNGSGKSNVTDAVLWALGEQSPLAVRGQSMQDVIFGGAPGRQAGKGAEVELVLDDSAGLLGLGAPEISIVRRLDRSGEGEYRLAGARCRLVDVIELLSDTGLGKEMHSVISQGRVESIVTSKPRERTAADRGGGRPGQAPQAPAPRAAEARAHPGEPRPRARRRARGALAAAAAQAPGGGGRAPRAARAPGDARRGGSWSRDDVRSRELELESAQRGRGRGAGRTRADRAPARGRGQAARGGRGGAGPRAAPSARSSRGGASSRSRRASGSATEPTPCGLRRPVSRSDWPAPAKMLESLAARRPRPTRRPRGRSPGSRRSRPALAALDRDREAELARQLADLNGQLDAAESRDRDPRRRVEGHARSPCSRPSRRSSRPAGSSARPSAASSGPGARRPASAVSSPPSTSFCAARRAVPGGVTTLSDQLEVDPGFELALAAALDGRLRAAVVPDRAAAASAARPRSAPTAAAR